MTSATALWAKTGLLWFLATMVFGLYLGLTQQFGASSPHAHLGLLGWLSAAAFAFLHAAADPDGELTGRARLHWGAHNLGMVVQVTSLWMVIRTGDGRYGMLIGIGGLIIILATLGLIAMLWPRLRRRA
ncbi:MAG TPA: hypothetical protein VGW34_00920 [Allosphingosinicella sp.]|nr:hypothetical protein [Allosphingosinicella sp.]